VRSSPQVSAGIKGVWQKLDFSDGAGAHSQLAPDEANELHRDRLAIDAVE